MLTIGTQKHYLSSFNGVLYGENFEVREARYTMVGSSIHVALLRYMDTGQRYAQESYTN